MICWKSEPNGGGLVEAAAGIDVRDHGFTVGDAVHTTTRTVDGKPERLAAQLERLAVSAELLRIAMPPTAEIQSAIATVCAAADRTVLGRLRITVTAGAGGPGLVRSGGWTLLVTWQPLTMFASTATLTTVDVPVNEFSPLTRAKTAAMAEHALALSIARAAGADEAVRLNTRGDLCECAAANLFLVIEGVATTPDLDSGALPGTTRAELLRRFPGLTAERRLTLADAASATEVFITSATRIITPVAEWDGRKFAAPGGITSQLLAGFQTSEVQ